MTETMRADTATTHRREGAATDRREGAATAHEPPDAGPPHAVFTDILCAVNGTRSSMAAVRQAAVLAGSEGRLTLLAVTALKGAGIHATAAISPSRVKHVLDYATALADEAGVPSTRIVNHAGPPVEVILEHARRHDLLALGAPVSSWLGAMLVGGVAAGALHRFTTPLLAARRSFSGSLHGRRVLVASDGLEGSERLVELAGRLGFSLGAHVTLLHALGPESRVRPHRIESQIHELELSLPGAADALVEPGRPHQVILEAAQRAEAALIVMGSRRLEGLRVLGSVSMRVVHDGPCSVLLLPPENG